MDSKTHKLDHQSPKEQPNQGDDRTTVGASSIATAHDVVTEEEEVGGEADEEEEAGEEGEAEHTPKATPTTSTFTHASAFARDNSISTAACQRLAELVRRLTEKRQSNLVYHLIDILTDGADDSDLAQAVTLCATHICEDTRRRLPRLYGDRLDNADALLKTWARFENESFLVSAELASFPRDELLRTLSEAFEDMTV